MGALIRGWRNVYRSAVRAVLVILLLGLSVATFLTMTQASAGVGQQARELAATVGTLIEVRAAGATGMGAGADALPESFFEKAQAVPDITRIEPYLYQRLRDPSKPASIAIVVGVRPGDTQRVSSHGEVGNVNIIAGRGLTPEDAGGVLSPSKGQNPDPSTSSGQALSRVEGVAVVGQVYADQYGLQLGDTFTIPAGRAALEDRPNPNVQVQDLTLEVVGIFQSGFVFGDNQVFAPLNLVQQAYAQEGKISHIFVTAASVDKVPQVERGLRQAFGDAADVISGQSTARVFAETLGSIEANGRRGSLAAIVVAAVVVLFTMALVTRERTREIGVLKAIGASDGDVAAQFVAESLALAAIGGLVGLIIFAVAGSALGSILLQRVGGRLLAVTAMGGGNPTEALVVNFGLSPTALAYALGVVFLLGLAGSLYPVARAARMRPAEAMRRRGS
jgi:putative ABC transport system permease protein